MSEEMEAKEKQLEGDILSLEREETGLRKRLGEVVTAKERSIGGLITVRSLLGKDALGGEVPELQQEPDER